MVMVLTIWSSRRVYTSSTLDPPTMNVPESFHGLSSTVMGSQSSCILFMIFSMLNSLDAESEISSNLARCYATSKSINLFNMTSLSGLMGNPTNAEISSQCLSFRPGLENTLTSGM